MEQHRPKPETSKATGEAEPRVDRIDREARAVLERTDARNHVRCLRADRVVVLREGRTVAEFDHAEIDQDTVMHAMAHGEDLPEAPVPSMEA